MLEVLPGELGSLRPLCGGSLFTALNSSVKFPGSEFGSRKPEPQISQHNLSLVLSAAFALGIVLLAILAAGGNLPELVGYLSLEFLDDGIDVSSGEKRTRACVGPQFRSVFGDHAQVDVPGLMHGRQHLLPD
jgi:hypothetical protein